MLEAEWASWKTWWESNNVGCRAGFLKDWWVFYNVGPMADFQRDWWGSNNVGCMASFQKNWWESNNVGCRAGFQKDLWKSDNVGCGALRAGFLKYWWESSCVGYLYKVLIVNKLNCVRCMTSSIHNAVFPTFHTWIVTTWYWIVSEIISVVITDWYLWNVAISNNSCSWFSIIYLANYLQSDSISMKFKFSLLSIQVKEWLLLNTDNRLYNIILWVCYFKGLSLIRVALACFHGRLVHFKTEALALN